MLEKIKDTIKQNRPKLSEGSIKTYSSTLNNLHKKLEFKSFDDFYKKEKEIIEFLKDKEPQNRKTIYASLIVLLDKLDDANDAVKEYRKIMMDDGHKSLAFEFKQEMTDKQAENWITYDDVIDIRNKLEKDIKTLWKKEKLSNEEYTRILNFVILSLYTFISPRRLVDYTEMKYKNYDTKNDNYYDQKNDMFIFNKYKTRGTYGVQNVVIPKELKQILTKWLKINTQSDYLITDNSRKSKITPQTLVNRFYAIFDRKISVSMLRHIYLSNLLKNMPELEKLNQISKDMGHSLTQQLLYVKKKV